MIAAIECVPTPRGEFLLVCSVYKWAFKHQQHGIIASAGGAWFNQSWLIRIPLYPLSVKRRKEPRWKMNKCFPVLFISHPWQSFPQSPPGDRWHLWLSLPSGPAVITFWRFKVALSMAQTWHKHLVAIFSVVRGGEFVVSVTTRTPGALMARLLNDWGDGGLWCPINQESCADVIASPPPYPQPHRKRSNQGHGDPWSIKPVI